MSGTKRQAAGERHKCGRPLVSGTKAAEFSGGRPRPLPAAWRDKNGVARQIRFGLAGSRRQRLNFGVEQMGASEGHHRAAFACFAIEFRATQAYKDVDSYKDVFS